MITLSIRSGLHFLRPPLNFLSRASRGLAQLAPWKTETRAIEPATLRVARAVHCRQVMTNDEITAATARNRQIAATDEGRAAVIWLNDVQARMSDAQHAYADTTVVAAQWRGARAEMVRMGWTF